MSMYALVRKLGQPGGAPGEVVAFAEDGAELREKLARYCDLGLSVWLAKGYADLHDECIGIMRRHLSFAGITPTFADDGVHIAVIELLEFRRRCTGGKPLDLGAVGKKSLCADCQMTEENHKVDGPGTKCPRYKLPKPPTPNALAQRAGIEILKLP